MWNTAVMKLRKRAAVQADRRKHFTIDYAAAYCVFFSVHKEADLAPTAVESAELA